MKVKPLVKKMSFAQLQYYCSTHDYTIPTANDAEQIDECEHSEFWVDELLGDRNVLYHKRTQRYRRAHPAMLFPCVVVRI